MEKMNMNKRGKRFCAGLLAAALGFSMVIPADVRAKEAAGNDLAESEIEAKEVPRGDYVVCAMDGAGEKEACLDEAQEIIRDGSVKRIMKKSNPFPWLQSIIFYLRKPRQG